MSALLPLDASCDWCGGGGDRHLQERDAGVLGAAVLCVDCYGGLTDAVDGARRLGLARGAARRLAARGVCCRYHETGGALHATCSEGSARHDPFLEGA